MAQFIENQKDTFTKVVFILIIIIDLYLIYLLFNNLAASF